MADRGGALGTMVIRLATPADAPAVAALQVRTWQAAYRGIVPEAFLSSLSPDVRATAWQTILRESPATTYVASADAGIVGWTTVGRCRDADARPTTGELWSIYVAPEHWGRGAGRALWARGAAHLTAAGFDEATLWVFRDNRRARRFYGAIGFSPDGAQKPMELGGVPVPEIRLRQRLDSPGA